MKKSLTNTESHTIQKKEPGQSPSAKVLLQQVNAVPCSRPV